MGFRSEEFCCFMYFGLDRMNDTHFTITVFIVLLLIASGVAMLTKWISVPYTLALVIVGLVLAFH